MQTIRYIRLEGLDSTNTYAKNNAHTFTDEFTVVQADVQYRGRGRLDRTFISDTSDGAWFSLVIKPKDYVITPEQVMLMPIMAGAAVAEGISQMYDIKSGIKWPNDVLINNKKVCGILCETQTMQNSVPLIVIGIGINMNQTVMHPDISDIATSMRIETAMEMPVECMIQNICGNILPLYDKIKQEQTACIINKWNEYSLMNNVAITYIKEQVLYNVLSKGIDMDGRLVIEQNGATKRLDSNEVRLKIQGV